MPSATPPVKPAPTSARCSNSTTRWAACTTQPAMKSATAGTARARRATSKASKINLARLPTRETSWAASPKSPDCQRQPEQSQQICDELQLRRRRTRQHHLKSGFKVICNRDATGQINGIATQASGRSKPVNAFVSNLAWTALNQPKAWSWSNGDTAARRPSRRTCGPRAQPQARSRPTRRRLLSRPATTTATA